MKKRLSEDEKRYKKLYSIENLKLAWDRINASTNNLSYKNLYRTLFWYYENDLLAKIGKSSPSFFEHLVVDLLVHMGYGGSFSEAAQVVGKSGDEGIDGIIKEDKLGLDTIYIQAKRWKGVVGRPEIQKFAGALLLLIVN